jgi:hypothetical protein
MVLQDQHRKLARAGGKLGQREDEPEAVELSDGKQGRVDLMLSKVVQPRAGEFDYLIVELKRPSKKIDDEVVTQIKKYARAVAGDERFRKIPARWTFVVISNELDDFARGEANQRNWPRGMIADDADLNITVWVKEWAEVINDARARLHFINTQLSYEADRDSASGYLKKTHAKFIPESNRKPRKSSDTYHSRVFSCAEKRRQIRLSTPAATIL